MFTPDPFLAAILQRPAFHASVSKLDLALFSSGDFSFIDAKVPSYDTAACALLETAGFHLIDTNVQLDCDISSPWPLEKNSVAACVRFATPADKARIEHIASSSFTFSRFHLDPRISTAAANKIKSQWAGNFFSGKRGHWMVVAESAGEPAAFLQLLQKDDAIIIDLIGVASAHQRCGLGSAMIRFAMRECAPASRMIVGTQISNVPSLRTYEALGFRVCSSSYIFHYHGPVRV